MLILLVSKSDEVVDSIEVNDQELQQFLLVLEKELLEVGQVLDVDQVYNEIVEELAPIVECPFSLFVNSPITTFLNINSCICNGFKIEFLA